MDKGVTFQERRQKMFQVDIFQNTRVMLLDFTKFIEILISLVRGVGGLKTLRVFCTRNYITEK